VVLGAFYGDREQFMAVTEGCGCCGCGCCSLSLKSEQEVLWEAKKSLREVLAAAECFKWDLNELIEEVKRGD